MIKAVMAKVKISIPKNSFYPIYLLKKLLVLEISFISK